MARNRMIKPEFWEDEVIGSLSFGARLLFIGMWNIADDEGLLRFNSAYLKSSIFIYDDISLPETEKFMNELINAQVIFTYTGGTTNQKYCYIINFKKHQKIDKPQVSKLPPPSLQNPKIKHMYFERDKMICHLCQSTCDIASKSSWCNSKYPSIDHLIPRSKGGSDYPSNIKTACLSCNKARGNNDIIIEENNSPNESGNESGTNTKEEKLREVKLNETSSNEEEAMPESLQSSEIISSLSETSSPPQVPATPPKEVEYGKPEINAMLNFLKLSLKQHLKLEAFTDSSNERNMANHCVNLCQKIGKNEFLRRFEIIVNDDFKQKNCNSIRYIYNQIKGFIEPSTTSSMVSA